MLLILFFSFRFVLFRFCFMQNFGIFSFCFDEGKVIEIKGKEF